MGHRYKRRRVIRVAEVDSRAPTEGPLAGEKMNEKGKHDRHRMKFLCTAQVELRRVLSNRNEVAPAMHLGMRLVRVH